MAEFHQRFRIRVQALQDDIDSLSDPSLEVSGRKARSDTVLVAITKLSADLADAASTLPSYDQRSYNNAIKELQDKLAIAQASHAPKPKFSFKNKRLVAATSEANSTSTSRSTTPSHLQSRTPEDVGINPTPALASPPTHLGSDHEAGGRQSPLPSPPKAGFVGPSEDAFVIGERSKAIVRFPDRSQTTKTAGNGLSCVISGVQSSIIQHVSTPQQKGVPVLTINDVSSSLVILPKVQGPAHITNLNNSVLLLSCHQFRMHASHNVVVYLYCSSRPIIEDCSGIRFADLSALINVETERPNTFDQVDDFKWLRAEPSPNWSLIQSGDQISSERFTELMHRLEKIDEAQNNGKNIFDMLTNFGMSGEAQV